MQTFYMITGRSCLTLYEREGASYKRVYLNGNPEFQYDINHMQKYAEQLFSILSDQYSLSSDQEISLTVIDSEDSVVSEIVNRELGRHIVKKLPPEQVLRAAAQTMCGDAELPIDEYGINYDGKNYLFTDNGAKKREFSLLGYTIDADALIQFAG